MIKSAICVSDLYKNFGRKKVLEGLSFSAPLNSIVGFLGPNGAGKTTTMRILLGLIPSFKGTVSLMGEEMPKCRDKALENIGAVVENPNFIETMTAAQNLKWFGSLYKATSQERIQEVIEMTGLKDAADRRFGTFSSGMKQRLGVAFGILHKPKLLILDEPTSGLDPAGRVHMREILMQIHDVEKTSIFLSSHLLDEVERMCDYVVIIDKGRTVAEGYVANLLDRRMEHFEVRVGDESFAKAREMLETMGEDGVSGVALAPRGLQFYVPAGKSGIVGRRLYENNVELRAMIPLEASLEETFIKLTASGEQQNGKS
jgi:ABC-2 type transport system ATP-binding protein